MRASINALFLGCIIFAWSSTVRASDAVVSTEEMLDNIIEAVEVHDSSIEDLLRLLAAQNELNLIIGPDSMGQVSLRFAEVTLRSALDAILRAKGFQYQLYNNILLVSRPDSLEKIRGLGLETEVFRLKYTDARDIKSTIDTSRVLSPWGYTTIYYRAVNLEAAKASGLKPSLEFVSKEKLTLVEQFRPGQLPLQTRSDILIITDKPPILKKVAALIKKLDRPSKQVAIDVHFVETILSDDHQLGIDWRALLDVEGVYQGKTRWILGEAPGSGAREGGIIEFGSLPDSRFSGVLEMMLENKRSKILSQPRITTIEDQPASITVGITTWIEERTGSLTGGDLQITYRERQVPIELVVVPHIIHNERILLELRPRVEEITGYQMGAGGLELPLISTRTADSRVKVKNGETAVIGGMIKERNITTERRVWLLSSIPLIGNLFRFSGQTVERTDLTIFITPRIIGGEEAIEEVGSDDSDRGSKTSDTGADKAAPRSVGGIDMRKYFPLYTGAHWGYLWAETEGKQWEAGLTVTEKRGDMVTMDESILSGPHSSKTRIGYLWSKGGMFNTFRVSEAGDSLAYAPPRVVLPRKMVEGELCENRYGWEVWDRKGKRIRSGRVVQQQRLIGRFTVNTDVGRFQECLAVETVWFNPGKLAETTRRKVVWYAPGIGPVKVENDIPPGAAALQGSLSARLNKLKVKS